MSQLNVELYGALLGTLTPKENGIRFQIDPDVLKVYPLSSNILSLAVPLNLHYSTVQKKRYGNFFAELLPESRNYEWLAQSLPYREQNIYGMLRRYGKDIAGALTIYDAEDPTNCIPAEAEPVDSEMIRYLLEHMPQAALANAPASGRTSLGGVQGKIVLAKKNSDWCRVHHGYPSTHILKPVVAEYPTIIYDEAFCMQLAFASGLTRYPVWVENFAGADALVIERYDRDRSTATAGRIHQEDFNQVLGASGSEKYQEYGGKVTAKRVAQILVQFGKQGDVEVFASQLIFAIAIGNLDMHTKNISILHLPDESIELAPVYDQVPLRHQNTDGKMALAIGGEYIHANVTIKNITSELVSWRHSSFPSEQEATAFVKNCLEKYGNALSCVTPNEKCYPGLVPDLSQFVSNLLMGRSIGSMPNRSIPFNIGWV